MSAAMTRETRKMWDVGDLRYDFNALMNNIFCLTNNIKLLSQQTLQHRQEIRPWRWMRCPVALVAADAWHSFSPFPIGGEVLSWKKKLDGSSFLAWQWQQ